MSPSVTKNFDVIWSLVNVVFPIRFPMECSNGKWLKEIEIKKNYIRWKGKTDYLGEKERKHRGNVEQLNNGPVKLKANGILSIFS